MYRKIIILGLSLFPFQMLFARTHGDVGPQGLAMFIVVLIGAILICILSNRLNKFTHGMHWFLKLWSMLAAIILTILILWGVFALLIPIFEYIPQKWLMLFE